MQGLDGQRSFPSRLIPLLADHLKGTHKILYSADAGVFPRKSNDRNINLTTHKYGAKIVNVRISAVIKETEQNQLTWYGHVQRMTEGRLPKIALKWMPKQKRARGRPNKNWKEGIRKAMNERNLNEGQWEDRKQWSLGVRQRRKSFETEIYIYIIGGLGWRTG